MSDKHRALSLTKSGGNGKDMDLTLEIAGLTKLSLGDVLCSPTETEKLLYSSKTALAFPLHEAVQNGDVHEAYKVLRTPQGNPMKQDYKGRTALHYSANYGNQQLSLMMTTEILNSSHLVDADGNSAEAKMELINIQDENGETALHLAAKSANRKVVQLLLFSSADVNKKSKKGEEPLQLIYANVPHALLAVFDRGITCYSGETHDDNFEVAIDFGVIVGYPVEGEEETPFPIESELLGYAVENSEGKCKEILVHPLVQLFIHFKWKKIRLLFWTSILSHIVWLLIYSKFLVDLYLYSCPYPFSDENNSTSSELGNNSYSDEETILNIDVDSLGIVECSGDSVNVVTVVFCTLVTALFLLKEIFELLLGPNVTFYFKKLENIGQLFVILLTAMTASPVWIYMVGVKNIVVIYSWQYQAAAFGIFLAWVLILGQIGKTPRLGIYVLILLKVLKSFGLFIVTFLSLLTAFALSFSILMPQNPSFKTWPLALSKVLVMMTGELNYDEIFYNEDEVKPIPFLLSGHIFFATFTIIVTIILFNLLIGFTVSDIQGLQKTAKVSGLASQLEQIYLMESFLFSPHLQRIFRLLRINTKFLNNFLLSSPFDEDDIGLVISLKWIPKLLQAEVKELATQNLLSDNTTGVSDISGLSESEKDGIKSLIRSVVKEVLLQQAEVNQPTFSTTETTL